jgi:hypothetical protein
VSGKAVVTDIPPEYVLGKGHVKFFYTRLGWLKRRYEALTDECLARGFNVKNIWPTGLPERLMGDYKVTQNAIAANVERINIRMPVKARYYGQSMERR